MIRRCPDAVALHRRAELRASLAAQSMVQLGQIRRNRMANQMAIPRGDTGSVAARLATWIKPRSSTVTIAAGLVSTRMRNRSWASVISRRLRTISATRSPHPMNARASNARRMKPPDGSSELNASLSPAHTALDGDRPAWQNPGQQHDGKEIEEPKGYVRLCSPVGHRQRDDDGATARATGLRLPPSQTCSSRNMFWSEPDFHPAHATAATGYRTIVRKIFVAGADTERCRNGRYPRARRTIGLRFSSCRTG